MPQSSENTQDLREHQAGSDQPFSNEQFTVFASHSELNLAGLLYSNPLDTSVMNENTPFYPNYLLQRNDFGQADQVMQQRTRFPGRTRTPDIDYTQFSLTNGDEAEPKHPVYNSRVHDRIWRPLGSLPAHPPEPLAQPESLTVTHGRRQVPFERHQSSLHTQVSQYPPVVRGIIPRNVYPQGSVIPRISGQRRSIQIIMRNGVSNIILPVPIHHRSLQRFQLQTVSPQTASSSQDEPHQGNTETQNHHHGMYDRHEQHSQASIPSAPAHTERVSTSGPEFLSTSGNHTSGPIINHLKRNPTTEMEDTPKIKRRRRNEESVDYGVAKTPLERARAVLAQGLGGKPKKYCDPTQPIRCQLEAIPGYTPDKSGLCGYLCSDSSELVAHILAPKNPAPGHMVGHGIGGSKGKKAETAARNPDDVGMCTWGDLRGCIFTKAQRSKSGTGKGKQKAIEDDDVIAAVGPSADEMVGGNLARHIATVHALLTREQDMAIRKALKLTRTEKDEVAARSDSGASPQVATDEGRGDSRAQLHHDTNSASDVGSVAGTGASNFDFSFNFDADSNTYTTQTAALDPSMGCGFTFGNNTMKDLQFAPQSIWGWGWETQHEEIRNWNEDGGEDHSQHIHALPILADTSGIASAAEPGGSTSSLDHNSGFHERFDLLHADNSRAHFNDRTQDTEREDDPWGGLEYVD